VRAAAAVGLGQLALPGSASIDNAHREAAAGALASAILSERDSEVKWRMAWSLGRAFYQSQPRTLRRLLTDDQELVRLFAVRGLGKLKDRSYALPIRLAVNDKSWRVRVEVRNALAALGDRTQVDVRPPPVPKSAFDEPAAVATSSPHGDHPQVAFVTNKGVIVIELFPDAAPYSVDNFLYLVDRGFYNGLTYFRVIADFVVQGGDPKNTGDGGPGYSIPAELSPLEQLTGIISYGLDYDQRRNVPLIDSAGSQYYITQSPQLHLDRGFTVFGRVVRGLSVVYAISPHNAGDAAAADVAKRVYRCRPVSVQSADVEEKLRTAEIGYQPQ
jgi:peptidyl-prolyl cis-trans isomerase B (cyclophilin B)